MDCVVHGVELDTSEWFSLFSLSCVGLEQKGWLSTLKPLAFGMELIPSALLVLSPLDSDENYTSWVSNLLTADLKTS